MCQNANIIVYIWSPNLAMCAVIKIGVCTQLMSDFSQSEFLSHFFTGRNIFFVIRSRTTLKFWSATTFGAVARNFGLVHKFELPTVIADSVPRATRVFSLASVGHVTGHMVSHMTSSDGPMPAAILENFHCEQPCYGFLGLLKFLCFQTLPNLVNCFLISCFLWFDILRILRRSYYPWKKCIKPKQSKRDREKLQPLFNIPPLNTPWQSSELYTYALDTLEYLSIQSIKKVWEILFSRGEKTLNPAQFATCPPSVFHHSRQANSALSGPKFRAGGPKFCTGPIICTSSKFCLVLDLVMEMLTVLAVGLKRYAAPTIRYDTRYSAHDTIRSAIHFNDLPL